MRAAYLHSVVALLVAATAAAESDPPAAPVPKDYEIATKLTPAALLSKQPAALELTITPKGNYALKTDTPFKARLVGSPGVKLDKSEFAAKDFVDAKTPQKTIRASFVAEAGKHSIDAELTFFLCTPELCQRFKDKVSLALDVK